MFGYDIGAAVKALGQQGAKVHFLEHIEVVVRGDGVRTDGDVHAVLQELIGIAHAAAELQVAGRVGRHRHALFAEDLDILVLRPDTVRRRGRHAEHPAGVEQRGGRHPAMALFAFLVLLFGLGQMDVRAHAVRYRSICKLLDDRAAVGIFGVQAHVDLQPAVKGIMPLA